MRGALTTDAALRQSVRATRGRRSPAAAAPCPRGAAGPRIAADGGTQDGTQDGAGDRAEGDGGVARRAWQRMLSGRRLDLLDPTPLDVEVEDIAHGLAFVARWNGQTTGEWPYSVAEHSLLVEEIFGRLGLPGAAEPGPRWRLAALLHDAPEYVIGDMISPVKGQLGPAYGELDARLAAAVHLRFGLPARLPAEVKRAIKAADHVSAWLEATRIAGFRLPEADRLFGRPDEALLPGLEIRLRPPAEARRDFLRRHAALLGAG